MDRRTTEVEVSSFDKVSPYQSEINAEEKQELLNVFQRKMKVIWAVPLCLTFGELVLLKHGKPLRANKISLFKWISYILAVCATNFSSYEALRRCEYVHRLYPTPPQIQKEHIRDAEILKRTLI